MFSKTKLSALALATASCFIVASTPASATHIPTNLDVNELWSPAEVKYEGYLEFINPTEYPGMVGAGTLGIPVPASPPGVIQTEEYTGYTTPGGVDVIEVGDSDTTAGDRADFDWVQENRACETGGVCNNAPQAVNHPVVGAMGWTVGSPDVSPHIDPGTGAAHMHSDEETPPGPLPHLDNDAFTQDFFHFIDVFSIISEMQDDETTARDSALDYEVAFGNSVTGASSPGVATTVWIPGWTALTTIDDYVARWVPLTPGDYNLVAIEPESGSGHDGRTEIDAIKAYNVPEPGTLALFGLGLAGLGLARRKRKAA